MFQLESGLQVPKASPNKGGKASNVGTDSRPVDYQLRLLWYVLSPDLRNNRAAGTRRMAAGDLRLPGIQERSGPVSHTGHRGNRQRMRPDCQLSARQNFE